MILGVVVIVLVTIVTVKLVRINRLITDSNADIIKELSNIKVSIGNTQVRPIVVEDRKKTYELFSEVKIPREVIVAESLSNEDIKHELAKQINIDEYMEIIEEYNPVRMIYTYRARLRVMK